MVSLVEKYGVPTILRALDHMVGESSADVVVSTAHKAKGREWGAVRLAGDFPQAGESAPSPPELRLLYVAATRAKRELDVSAVSLLNPPAEAPTLPTQALDAVEATDGAEESAVALTARYGTRQA